MTATINTANRNHFDPDNKVLVLRQSAIQSFLDCRRKFYWEYVRGIEPEYTNQVTRPWTTPDCGTAVHLCLEHYYQGQDWGAPLDAWFAERFPQGDRDEKVAKGRRLVETMVRGYIDDMAETGADAGEETLHVEHQLHTTVQVGDWDVTVTGQIDRVLRDADGKLVIEDTKTTDSLDTTLQYIQQLGRYAVLYRIETGGQVADRVRSNQIKRVLRTKEGPFFSRPWIPMTEEAYDSHWTSLHDTLSDIIRCYHEERWYERVSKDCSWKCRVRDVCIAQQHGDNHETIVDLYYREKDYS